MIQKDGFPFSFRHGALYLFGCIWMFSGCASQIQQVKLSEPEQSSVVSPGPSTGGLKHRIAIASFEDKSGYGSNMFGTIDDLGSQASDILAAQLIKTGDFIVLEREKIGNLKSEAELQGREAGLAGVTALILGSVTEFGTKTDYMDAGLSKTKVQTAHAKVTLRMVDPLTGESFFSEFGSADVNKEMNQVLGFGSSGGYDATLTDKALNGAITKLVGNILLNLQARPWKAPILDIQDGQIFIGAGSRAGLKVGQTLAVVKPGKRVKNPATGSVVELPGTRIARLKVVSQFGTTDLNEGSQCAVLDGGDIQKEYYVVLEEGA